MTTETYILVEYKRYEYNTGASDNGEYWYSRKFNDTPLGKEKAKAFAQNIQRAIRIEAQIKASKASSEDITWLYEFENLMAHNSGYYVSVRASEVTETHKSITL